MNTFSQKKVIGLLAAIVVFVMLMGAGSWLAYRVYVVRDDGRAVRMIGRWLPVAKVAGHRVTYGEFLDTRDTLRTYLSSPSAKQAGAPEGLTSAIERDGLTRLIRNALTKDLAQERHVTLTDDDVKNSFDAMKIANSSTVPDVQAFLHENYNWTENDFREQVIRPAILEERVSATLASSSDAQYAEMEAYMTDRMAKPDVKIYLRFDN